MFEGIKNNNGLISDQLDLVLEPEERVLAGDINYSQGSVIIIAGPTACGKTELSLILAQQLDGEIVSADSMQVYRGMNIGSAKATPEQQASVPHHLIDTNDIDKPMNAADFAIAARKACDSILARNKVPILVGGSGFYITAFMYDSLEGPPSDPDIRSVLTDEVDMIGVDVAYKKLFEYDPEYASTITKNDRQKIIRALEIIKITGKKVSDFPWRERSLYNKYNFYPWFVYRDRSILYSRAEERCDWMLQNGFLEEVVELDKLGIRENSSAAMSIGYRQALHYLDGDRTEENYRYFVDKFKQATRNYIKRQFTWFKQEPYFQHLDLDFYDVDGAVKSIVEGYLII